MHVLVTGAAGFIGYALAQRLLARGDIVIGIDDMNAYYQVSLKEDRVRALAAGFTAHMAKPVDPQRLVGLLARLSPSPRAK